MKKQVCCICGEEPGALDKLWPYGRGEYICSSCSITESIHADSTEMYEYDEYETWGDEKSYNH